MSNYSAEAGHKFCNVIAIFQGSCNLVFIFCSGCCERCGEDFVCEDILRTDGRQGSDNDGCQVKDPAGGSDLRVYQGRFGR